jgi:hypothetical protein
MAACRAEDDPAAVRTAPSAGARAVAELTAATPMIEVRRALAAAIQAEHPYVWCWACLAAKLTTTPGKVRDAAQILLFAEKESFVLVRRVCSQCRNTDQVLVYLKSGS